MISLPASYHTVAIPCAVCPRFSGLPPPLNAPRGPVFSHSHGCDHRSAVFGDKIGSAPQKPQASCTLEHTGEVYYYWSKCEASGVHAPWLSAFTVCVWACGSSVTVIHGFHLHSTHTQTHGTHTLSRRERDIFAGTYKQSVNANVTFVSHIGSEYTNVLTANCYGC